MIDPIDKEILTLFSNGLKGKDIAFRINLSLHTVYSRIKRMTQETKSGTLTGLVAMALRKGWIQ